MLNRTLLFEAIESRLARAVKNNEHMGVLLLRLRRLRPRLMLLLTRLKERFERFPELDLMTAEVDGSGNKIDIIGTPEPGTWGLDPTELYLV